MAGKQKKVNGVPLEERMEVRVSIQKELDGSLLTSMLGGPRLTAWRVAASLQEGRPYTDLYFDRDQRLKGTYLHDFIQGFNGAANCTPSMNQETYEDGRAARKDLENQVDDGPITMKFAAPQKEDTKDPYRQKVRELFSKR